MLCARSSRTRSPTLRSSAHRPLPVLTPVAATVSETTKSHHACSAERTDQVSYSGDQARVGVCNHSKRSHNVSPFFAAVLHRRMHRTLSAGPQARFGEAARWIGAAALASDSNVRATESPKSSARNERPQPTGNIEPPCRQSSRLQLGGPTQFVFKGLLALRRRMMITNRAVNLAQATVNGREITK
jgi:hypothetical protein